MCYKWLIIRYKVLALLAVGLSLGDGGGMP